MNNAIILMFIFSGAILFYAMFLAWTKDIGLIRRSYGSFSTLCICVIIKSQNSRSDFMKYSPASFNLWGDNFFVYRWTCTLDQCDIFLKSRSDSCVCPYCGKESHHIHSTYVRTLQEIPFFAVTTYLHVNLYRYYCDNPDCKIHMFGEQLPFAHERQVRTDTLNTLILSVSTYISNEGTSCILNRMGVIISNDTIGRMYDNIDFIDDPDVEAIGIDDVAIRKGQKYATAIYDMKDHHLMALLNGRDSQVVKDWLKSHTKIKIVARDRASAYASAIQAVLPECLQVADRFHLLQNLLKELKNIFYGSIPQKVFIKDGEVLKENPLEQPLEKIVETFTYDNTPPVDVEGNEIQVNVTLLFCSEGEDSEAQLAAMWRNVKSFTKASYDRYHIASEIKRFQKSTPFAKAETLAHIYNLPVDEVRAYLKMTDEEILSLLNGNVIHNMVRDIPDHRSKPLKKRQNRNRKIRQHHI